MKDRIDLEARGNEGFIISRDMLLRAREVDPGADPEAVERYAREIAEADAVLQTLKLDPSHDPLEASFSPDWTVERES